jgi:hypothetical protein
VDAGAANLRDALLAAAASLPKSLRAPGTPPFWNGACKAADDACRRCFAAHSAAPSAELWAAYLQTKHDRLQTVSAQRRLLFQKRVSVLNPARAADWNLVKSRDRHPDFRSSVIAGVSSLPGKANLLARHFSPPTPSCDLRAPPHTSTPRVTMPELEAALHQTQRGRARGPDGIHPEFLRDDLSLLGRTFLLSLMDASLFSGHLPAAWKHAHWLPLLKPGKPAQEPTSSRPISLTSVVAKVAERLVATRIRADPACCLDPRQHGFRRGHRAEDALARLVDAANRAWNDLHDQRFVKASGQVNYLHRSGRASATLLDLTSAFDNLRHDKLHLLLRRSGFPAYLTLWVLSFLRGRTAQVVLHKVSSRVRQLSRGGPQGTVLGPLLFLLYINPVVPLLRTVSRVDPTLYADDITLLAVGPTAADCANHTQRAVALLLQWCSDNGMPIAPAKSQAILFTPSHTSDEDNRGIRIGDVLVPLSRQTTCKLLGVHLDAEISFGRHVALTRASATQQLRLLRHAVTQVGPAAHTLRTFGRALIESRIFYSVGGWGAQLSDFELKRLESTQRELARAITGLVGQAPPLAPCWKRTSSPPRCSPEPASPLCSNGGGASPPPIFAVPWWTVPSPAHTRVQDGSPTFPTTGKSRWR